MRGTSPGRGRRCRRRPCYRAEHSSIEEMSSVLPSSNRQGRPGRDGNARSSRSKRAEILATATEYFGRHGYEHTKWADIAAAVGVGSTALYHYFESKLHCLYEIQA